MPGPTSCPSTTPRPRPGRSHIWLVGYGTTFSAGKPDESFEPLITMQVGVKTIVLVDHLDAASGKMFEHLFRNDTRRFWHGHN